MSSFKFYVCVTPDDYCLTPNFWVGLIYRDVPEWFGRWGGDRERNAHVASFVEIFSIKPGGLIRKGDGTIRELKVRRVL